MIKVIERGDVPTARLHCINCGSLLEYGNDDLTTTFEPRYDDNCVMSAYNKYLLRCPVCGCNNIVGWIIKEGE